MTAYADEKPILLIKLFRGFILLFGFLLPAVGFNAGPTGLAVLGILLLAGGLILLAQDPSRQSRQSALTRPQR